MSKFFDSKEKRGCTIEVRIYNMLRTRIMSSDEIAEELNERVELVSDIMIFGMHVGIFDIKIIDNRVLYTVRHTESDFFDSKTALPQAIIEMR